MPHSGGGGSHGGGSHGGSHSSSGRSYRTSHTYFPGARRYRRHYNDGRPDEYFYTNGKPQKAGVGILIFTILFGGVFSGIAGLAGFKSIPKPIEPVYEKPDHYVYDSIDVIEDDDDLEEILEDMSEKTGICPIVYTTVIEEYENDYVDLESFAYVSYINQWDDEQHYYLIYAVPVDQVEDIRNGNIEVPDYEYEIMMGDETDSIISESMEDFMNNDLHGRFELGQTPGKAITEAFESLSQKAERAVSSKIMPFKALMPFIIVVVFFLLVIAAIIKSIIRDRGVEFEEVPLTEKDGEYVSSYPSGSYIPGSARAYSEIVNANPGTANAAVTIVKIILVVFLLPFLIVGFVMITSGVAMLFSTNVGEGAFVLGFGIVWELILVVSMVSIFRAFKKRKSSGSPMTADYPKAEMPTADYPSTSYPATDYPSTHYPEQEYGSSTHDDCKSSHEEDEDSIRKGYE